MGLECISCGSAQGMTRFENERHGVTFRDLRTEVDGLSGVRCADCGEIEFDAESAARYAEAGDALVLQARRAVGEELRRIRKKLGLNQAQASALTGGGHNAFSRYETGKVIPAPAVVNLFRMLDRHPEEVGVLKRA
ncbi:type II toxin-antitoxin system MqsA family antitoxin [Rhizobium sp. AAP43]|uniref:type II toxin-antitoxin system MqsA family antitoxin n=1 Tax=Rhizobium sp. AAP43 TaxID=1523420 RepID=UPI0006B9B591|nr:type II toxin-antitoxin system MqsA family antitoxin [Rhizobium sp. AAP43]KPF42291.1 XRE family transcriptional regulator [Rhizobium sp. AAP43]